MNKEVLLEDLAYEFYQFLVKKIEYLEETIKMDNNHLIHKYDFNLFKEGLYELENGINKEENDNIKKMIIYNGDPNSTIYFLLLHTIKNNKIYLCTENPLNNTNKFILETYQKFCQKYGIESKITLYQFINLDDLEIIKNKVDEIESYLM